MTNCRRKQDWYHGGLRSSLRSPPACVSRLPVLCSLVAVARIVSVHPLALDSTFSRISFVKPSLRKLRVHSVRANVEWRLINLAFLWLAPMIEGSVYGKHTTNGFRRYLFISCLLIKKFDLHKLIRECSNVFRTYRNNCKCINVGFPSTIF